MATDLGFEQWVQHVFDHPVAKPPWYFQIDPETWDGTPVLTVQHVIRLFESPWELLKEYSAEQLEQGLWYLGGEGQPFMQALLDESVPWNPTIFKDDGNTDPEEIGDLQKDYVRQRTREHQLMDRAREWLLGDAAE